MAISCKTESVEISSTLTGPVFYDDSNNVLWRHRVNTTEELLQYSAIFKGIEFDVNYDNDEKLLYVSHDIDSSVTLTLEEYFKAIPQNSDMYFWMDIKNLSPSNCEIIAEHILNLLSKLKLEKKVICESYDAESLAVLHNKGLFTSYWIPHPEGGDYSLLENEDVRNDITNKILNNLKKCKHNAISSSYEMLPLIKEKLPNCTTHIWTNGLETEEDKQLIEQFAGNDNVKIVLIDYEKPF